MKTLYIIGGPMGVGKTATCLCLKQKLNRSVFLDGDWCWDMHPFQVTEETKTMVMDNICHVLNNFIACSAYEHVIFCWVLHQQDIIDTLLSRLHTTDCAVRVISLVCSEQALSARLRGDMQNGIRTPDILDRSLVRLPLYAALHTQKVDVSDTTPAQAADAIIRSG